MDGGGRSEKREEIIGKVRQIDGEIKATRGETAYVGIQSNGNFGIIANNTIKNMYEEKELKSK